MPLLHMIVDLFLPPRCGVCQKIVKTSHSLCQKCWTETAFILDNFCEKCGRPIGKSEHGMCGPCLKMPPPFHRARFVSPYDEVAKSLILSFKHGDRGDLAPMLALWMVRTGKDLIAQCDVVVAVPLHWRRRVMRTYNQADLLCREISKLTQIRHQVDGLRRTKNTQSQGHLSRLQRSQNVQSAFKVNPTLAGKKVLLVDDVLTTGATVINCTNVLLSAGCDHVNVLTFARVL